MLVVNGVTAIEVSVTAGALDPPPPPLQFMISKKITIKKSSLFNFINTDPFGYQSRHEGSSLHVSHMSPSFNDNIIRFNPRMSAPRLTLELTYRLLMFRIISSKELRQIRIGQAVPCYAEDNS